MPADSRLFDQGGHLGPRVAPEVEVGPLWLNGGPRRLRTRWFGWVTVGQFLALAVVAAAWLLVRGSGVAATTVALVLAGSLAGAVSGVVQGRVLDREILGFSLGSWVGATSVGSAAACLVAAPVLASYHSWERWPEAAAVTLGLLVWAVLLVGLAAPQARVLRRHVAAPWRWVVGSALGWSLGLGVLIAVTAPLWQGATPGERATLLALGGGLVAMATTVAWTTGVALVLVLAWPEGARALPRVVPAEEWDLLAGSTDRYVVFDPEMVEDLPEAVQRWLLHAVTPGTPLLTAADVETEGHVRLGSGWKPCRSRQRLSLPLGFIWATRVTIAGLPLWGYDRFTRETAQMDWSVLGRIPLVSSDEETATRTAAGRHAAEVFALLPAAALDPAVRWVGLGENRAAAYVPVGGTVQRVTIVVAPNGSLRQLTLDRWGTPPDAGYGRYRYGAKFEAEGYFDGYRLPTVVTAGWYLGSDRWDTGRFIRYRVTSVTYR